MKKKMDINKILLKISPEFIRGKIGENKGLRKILDNINWLTFENIFKLLIGLFVYAWIARSLGPEQFGLMNYSLAFVTLFLTFSTLGLDGIVIRNIVSNPKKKREFLGSAFFLKILGSILMILFSIIIIYLLEPNNKTLFLFVFIIALGYIFKSFDVIDLWFKSQVEAKYPVYSRIIALIIITLLKISFILLKAPLIAFIYMFSLDFLIVSLLFVYFYYKKTKISLLQWRVRLNTIKDLLKDSWPLILSGMAIMLYMRIDQVMIGHMLGQFELGIYSAAVKLSEAWYFMPIIITSSVFPAIINARKKSKELYIKRMQILYDSFTWFTILVAVIVTLLSPFIINILYGQEYARASTVLSILIFSGIFTFLGVASSNYLIAENLTKISFYITTIGVVINILLNIMLIPLYGINGAAVATLISYSFAAYISNLFFKKSRIVFMMQTKSFNIIRIMRSLL